MEKKKWHRSPGIKGLLLLLQYIFLGAVIFLGLFLITSLAHGLRLSDSGKDYLDSTAFANTLYDAAYDVMYGISVTFPYTNVSWKGLAQNEASQSSDKNASSAAHTSLNQTSASQLPTMKKSLFKTPPVWPIQFQTWKNGRRILIPPVEIPL